MEIKISVHLKSGKVISYIESNLNQGTIDRWLDGLLDDENEWISIGDLPSMSLVPIKVIECITFEEITQTQEREQEKE
ncbi:hypothetical protein N2D50_04085 [Enterococcus faecalis]|uniref:hypothetical protein n=1 Tax=Enterococcus faecalis TaxID=1351 RepID=UPI000353AB79|nr:hypothetical protein [Enterococcus faecalis]EPH89735.1 hypothetical protein D921_02684 [Enterococcus faecalis F01966]MCU2241442.1 hypothetical protein [Enterococcus faecalis]